MPPKMRGVPKPTATAKVDFSQPSTSTAADIRFGEQACIIGLKTAHLNGRVAVVGAFDQPSGRFDVWLAPMCLSTELKMNWVDAAMDEQAAVRIKPCNLQPVNVNNRTTEEDYERLAPQHKVAVLRAQKALWDESTIFKDGKRRAPNVVKLFGAAKASLVVEPQRLGSVLPPELSSGADNAIVVCRELDEISEGVGGWIYVVASSPRVFMGYRALPAGNLLDGKVAADAFLRLAKSV